MGAVTVADVEKPKGIHASSTGKPSPETKRALSLPSTEPIRTSKVWK